MRYYIKDGNHFVENGLSLVEVFPMAIVGDIYHPGRVGKIFSVKEVKKFNPKNQICPGFQFCLSFPPDKANAKEYTWTGDEPRQIPLKMKKASRPLTATEEALS